MRDFLKLIGIIAIVSIITYLFFRFAITFALPFVIAVFLSIIMEPIVALIENNLKLKRTLSTLVVLFALSSLIIFVVTLGISRLIIEIRNLASFLPRYYFAVEDYILNTINDLSDIFERLPPELILNFQGDFREVYRTLYTNILTFAEILRDSIFVIFSMLPGIFIVIVVALIATFFFTKDREIILKGILKVFPEEFRHGAEKIQLDVMESILGFIKAQVVLISITTVLTVIGFMVLRIQYALILGLISGFLDVLPILGPGLIIIPMIIYHFIAGKYLQAGGLLLLYGLMVVTRSIMEAKLVGKNIGLHPLATLIAIYVGLTVMGVWGLIMGPILIIFIRSFVNSGLIKYKK